MWTIMNLKWTAISFATTYIVGVIGGVALMKFCDMYQEARDAGVIA